MIRGSPQLGLLTVSVRSIGKMYIDENNTEQLIFKSLPQCSGNIRYNPWEWAKENLHLLSFFNIFYGMCSTKRKIFLQYSSHLLTSSIVVNISRYFRRNPCIDFFHHSDFCIILEEDGNSGMIASLVEELSGTVSNQPQAHSATFPHLYNPVLRPLWIVTLLAVLNEKNKCKYKYSWL